MNIQLTDQNLKGLVSEAILSAMTEESRKLLIQQAVENLLAPQAGQYGRSQPTLLQSAFNDAVAGVARKVAMEQLENDESLSNQVRSLMDEAMQKLMTERRDATVNSIAEAISRGLSCSERY